MVNDGRLNMILIFSKWLTLQYLSISLRASFRELEHVRILIREISSTSKTLKPQISWKTSSRMQHCCFFYDSTRSFLWICRLALKAIFCQKPLHRRETRARGTFAWEVLAKKCVPKTGVHKETIREILWEDWNLWSGHCPLQIHP